MRFTKYFMKFAVAILIYVPITAMAQEASISVAEKSSYYFRGDYVWQNKSSTETSINFAQDGFSFTLWSIIPHADRTVLRDVRDEVNIILDYTKQMSETLSITAGTIIYLYPASTSIGNTEELFVSFNSDWSNGFGIYGGIYADIDNVNGSYITIGPTYTKPINKFVFTANGVLSATDYEDWAIVESGFTANLSYPITPSWNLYGGLLGNYNFHTEDSQVVIHGGIEYSIK